MKLLIVIASAAILGGCAASVQNPSLAQQNLNSASCKAEAGSSNNAECIAAKGKAKPKVDAFPFEIG
jgi:hypothetical protein